MVKRGSVISFIMLFILSAGIQALASESTKKNVFVSILPQKYFVDAIGGELVDISVIVPPNHNPEDYEPSPAQMVQMAKADMYFAVGVPFENTWLEKFSDINPKMQVVYTDAGIEKKPIDRHEIFEPRTENPGHGHEHSHGVLDPHIWLSPPLVKIQAGDILKGLIDIDPGHSDIYNQNYLRFIEQIDRLDRELKSVFAQGSLGKKFLVFHPAWGYFADAYGLIQISIEIEGKDPKARDVKQLIEYAKQHRIKLIFVQPQLSPKYAELIAAEIGGRIIFADPLAENWVDNMRSVALSIKQALK